MSSESANHSQPFITAEIGINHNGDLLIAQKLIDMAIRCGCDAVKFQKRTIDKVYSKEFLDSPRESPWGTTQREQKYGLEFGQIEYDWIDAYCNDKIDWYASAWDVDSQLFLRKYNLKYNKIASKMIYNTELLECVAEEGKHTFISTAEADTKLIEQVLKIFDYKNVTLMHCVAVYPCPIDKCDLWRMKALGEIWGDVGYSCHCPSLLPTTVATALGATALEKHVTLDRTMYGTDQPASLEERGLQLMVRDARNVKLLL